MPPRGRNSPSICSVLGRAGPVPAETGGASAEMARPDAGLHPLGDFRRGAPGRGRFGGRRMLDWPRMIASRDGASMSQGQDTGEVRRHSGWLIPLGVLVVIALLSGLVLLFYLFPSPPPLFAEQIEPTSSAKIVALEVNGLKLWIPANYIELESARRGGARREVALFALFPDMGGWSNWDAGAFADNSPQSRVIYMPIRADRIDMTEAERLKRVYLAYAVEPQGRPGPYGLTKYAFRPGSGYRSEDLFVGETDDGLALLHCAQLGPEVPSPNCWRDLRLRKGVTVSYRFKRAKLAHWREISDGVKKLLSGFERPPAG
jgi:hypothetical protein